MQTVFDIVDLLQLQEVWVRLPITQAFSRLERRQNRIPCPIDFSVRWLMPRLGEVGRSAPLGSSKPADPAQTPMCALSDRDLEVLYPTYESAAAAREELFLSAYNHFVVGRHAGDVEQTFGLLAALADVRAVGEDCLTGAGVPLAGSNFWIPVDLTDEIRALDSRYDSTEPGAPATFVIADESWLLLVKATPDDVRDATARYCQLAGMGCIDESVRQLNNLIELARDWNRSSSVVGLCYQVHES